MDDLIKVVLSQTGLLGAAVIAFVFALWKHHLVWGVDLKAAEARARAAETKCETECDAMRADFDARATQMRLDFEKREAQTRADMEEYRGFCMELARHAGKMAEVTRTVVGSA